MSATTHKTKSGDQIASEMFAEVFHAYMEASDDVQAVIRDMCAIMNDCDTDEDEYDAARSTLIEAIFPSHHDGELGIDIEQLRVVTSDESDQYKQELEVLDREQETFSNRLESIMAEQKLTQEELAERIGVQQPAISMMLNRKCRPQKRTLQKIAAALDVPVERLWPTKNPNAASTT